MEPPRRVAGGGPFDSSSTFLHRLRVCGLSSILDVRWPSSLKRPESRILSSDQKRPAMKAQTPSVKGSIRPFSAAGGGKVETL